MADQPPSSTAPPPPPPPPPTPPSAADPTQYWCYQCDKRVPIETLPGQADVICFECKNGFVELISVHQPIDDDDQPAFGHDLISVLRLLALSARDPHAPPPNPDNNNNNININNLNNNDNNDYLRFELDGWDIDNDDVNNDDDDVSNDDDEGEDEEEEDHENNNNNNQDNEQEEEEDDEDQRRRRQRDVIRLRLRDFAARALSGRNRILDWAEILTGLEDHSIEFRLQGLGERDGYIGNPGDYLDAAGYERLLQTLAESDNGMTRGAPPAKKSVVEGLPIVKVEMISEGEDCAVCKDKLVNSEEEVVKELPCGHLYHEECIVPWLGARNTCPVCRFELETDDLEYEEERKRRLGAVGATSGSLDDAV